MWHNLQNPDFWNCDKARFNNLWSTIQWQTIQLTEKLSLQLQGLWFKTPDHIITPKNATYQIQQLYCDSYLLVLCKFKRFIMIWFIWIGLNSSGSGMLWHSTFIPAVVCKGCVSSLTWAAVSCLQHFQQVKNQWPCIAKFLSTWETYACDKNTIMTFAGRIGALIHVRAHGESWSDFSTMHRNLYADCDLIKFSLEIKYSIFSPNVIQNFRYWQMHFHCTFWSGPLNLRLMSQMVNHNCYSVLAVVILISLKKLYETAIKSWQSYHYHS